MYSFQAHTEAIQHFLQLPNGFIATTSADNTSKIWSPSSSNNNWTLVRTYTGHTATIFGIDYIDTDTLITGAYDMSIKIWSITTGLTNKTINATQYVRSLKLLSNGYHLAVGLYGTWMIKIFNINTGSLVSTLTGHTSSVNDLKLISSTLLASASSDQSILIWNLTTYTLKLNLSSHTNDAFSIKMISSSLLASGSWDKSVKLWNITSGALLKTLSNATGSIYWSVDLIDSQTLVSGSMDTSIVIWNVTSGQILKKTSTSFQIRALCVFDVTIGKIQHRVLISFDHFHV